MDLQPQTSKRAVNLRALDNNLSSPRKLDKITVIRLKLSCIHCQQGNVRCCGERSRPFQRYPEHQLATSRCKTQLGNACLKISALGQR